MEQREWSTGFSVTVVRTISVLSGLVTVLMYSKTPSDVRPSISQVRSGEIAPSPGNDLDGEYVYNRICYRIIIVTLKRDTLLVLV